MEFRKMVMITLYAKQKKRRTEKNRCTEQNFWTLWEKASVGCFERITKDFYLLFHLGLIARELCSRAWQYHSITLIIIRRLYYLSVLFNDEIGMSLWPFFTVSVSQQLGVWNLELLPLGDNPQVQMFPSGETLGITKSTHLKAECSFSPSLLFFLCYVNWFLARLGLKFAQFYTARSSLNFPHALRYLWFPPSEQLLLYLVSLWLIPLGEKRPPIDTA